jgi:hypothetical protein
MDGLRIEKKITAGKGEAAKPISVDATRKIAFNP